MCGIMGVIGKTQHFDHHKWGKLTGHRGPDAFGLWQDGDALLGHNRLAIIDLSVAANQPMTSSDDEQIIVFNGEIFNFLELRKEMEGLGATFHTHSDTEVLLEGYRRWGAQLLPRLDGMFAFAIWDKKKQTLFAARDHVGIKPFFYKKDPGTFSFGSELKLLTYLSPSRPTIRPASIYEYLIYSYIPAPFTAYEGYFKLEPGSYLEYDYKTDGIKLSKWWAVPKIVRPQFSDMEEASSALRKTFRNTVEKRMISDVPLGAFLSGGIDSSVIVAEMVAVGQSVRTFSIGYKNNPEYDETKYAEQVANHLGTKHTVLYPEFQDNDIDEYLDLIIKHFDEPFGNPTVSLTHLLTKAAREHVTVAMVGDGGDELFGGYPRHKALLLADRVRGIVGPLAPIGLRLLSLFPETPNGNHRARRARRFLSSLEKPLNEAFQDWSSVFPINVIKNDLSPKAIADIPEFRTSYIADYYKSCDQDALANALYADLNSFVPYNLLEGADRMSMANSFELRVPFVSKEMIELAAAIPSHMKIHKGVQKFLLKHAYRDVLPASILNRKKRGFNPPVWHWLQTNESFVRSRLADKALEQYVLPGYTLKTLNDFYAKRGDYSIQIWMLLVLQKWLASQNELPD